MRTYLTDLLYEYAIVDIKAFESYKQNQRCADYFEGAAHADLMMIETVEGTLEKFIKYAKKQRIKIETILNIRGEACLKQRF